MSDYAYVQDFVYNSSESLINNSIFGGTITDVDNDDQFETGDLLFGVHSYAGTITVDLIRMPIFLRSDGAYHAYNPGPGFVTPPATLPTITGPSGNNFLFCFGPGTLIATPGGEVAVEDLRIGDLIKTAAGKQVTVKWLGRQTVDKLSFGAHMQPVRIRARALGGGLPHSDLTVTADHGMVFPSSSEAVRANDGLVINASALVNGSSIDFVPMAELGGSFTVYHIETEAHDVILANGAPSETFIDMAGRKAFDNYREYLDLYGAEHLIREMPLPRIAAPRLVPQAIQHRLNPNGLKPQARIA